MSPDRDNPPHIVVDLDGPGISRGGHPELARMLRIAPTTDLVVLTSEPTGSGEFKGFIVEAFGRIVGPSEWNGEDLGAMMFGPPRGGSPEVMAVLCRRVRHPDTPAFVEQRWRPGEPTSISIRGLERVAVTAQARLALRGLGVLDRRSRTEAATRARNATHKRRVDEASRLRAAGHTARETARLMGIEGEDAERSVRRLWSAGRRLHPDATSAPGDTSG